MTVTLDSGLVYGGVVMRIIKECCPNGENSFVCVLRTDTYAKSLAYFLELFAVAQEDFPKLTPDQVTVVKYGGQSIRRTCGIEFQVHADTPPPGYSQVYKLHETL